VSGIALVVFNPAVRGIETVLSARFAGLITGSRAVGVSHSHTFYWLVGTSRVTGLIITSDCTSAILIGPVLVAVAIFAFRRRVPAGRLFAAAVLVSGMLFVANLLRLGLITWATYHYGGPGFTWSHVILGSLLTLVAFAGALVALALVIGRGSKPHVPMP
jgi:exosortase/archaeosortase family protein